MKFTYKGLDLYFDDFPSSDEIERKYQAALAAGEGGGPQMRAEASDRAPLSANQRGLWILHRLDPESVVYVIVQAVLVRGALDRSAVEGAFADLLERHEIFRTTFEEDSEGPYQRIHPLATADIVKYWDVSHESDPHGGARQVLIEESQIPFKLATEPALRIGLIRLSDEEHVLVLAYHHIAADEWTTGVVFEELPFLYFGRVSGESGLLPEPEFQYADFARWQQKKLQGPAFEAAREFWRDRMEGVSGAIQWPWNESPGVTDPHWVRVEIDESTSKALHSLATRYESTVFVTLCALYAAFLSRLTGAKDIVVGTPVSQRPRVELHRMAGFFLNTVPLRLTLNFSATFAETLRAVRDEWAEVERRTWFPFDEIVKVSGAKREAGAVPLVEAMFSYLPRYSWRRGSYGGIEFEAFQWDPPEQSRAGLTLLMSGAGDRIRGKFTFDASRFRREDVITLAAQFRSLVQSAVADPEARLGGVEIDLGRAPQGEEVERRVRPGGGNHQALHRRFEEVAAKFPETVAVTCGSDSLSYAALNARANGLADRLVELGIGPECVVPLVVRRSIDMLVGVLGIWKAGAAYLPLEASDPDARREFILEDSGASVVVAQSDLADSLAAQLSVVVLRLEEFREERSATRGAGVDPDPDSLAYLIYTSGSTGKPKGAMITHRGLGHYARWCESAFGVEPGPGSPLHSSFSFDLGMTGWLPSLLAPRPIHILDDDPGAQSLVDALQAGERYGLAKMTPTHLRILNETFDIEQRAEFFDVLVLGGEQLLCDDVRGLLENSDVRVFNHYGPTETVVGVCANELDLDELGGGPVPIGHPMPHVQALVLDSTMAQVPPEWVGQLFIGGESVCRGYHARPRATAERFVPDPFNGHPGARAYRTGDRVSRELGGKILFHGRADQQVKIRGYRVEPAEIERNLERHPAVRRAAVIPIGRGAHLSLAGFVSVSESVDSDSLRRWLATELPPHMVPATILVLPELPQTPNGKLDRRALSQYDIAAPAGMDAAAPAGEREEAVAAVWRELLDRQTVGRFENFFDLGGDSILAVRMVSQVRARGYELTPRQVFERPTVSALAEILVTLQASPDKNTLHVEFDGEQQGLAKARLAGMVEISSLRAAAEVVAARHFGEASCVELTWIDLRGHRGEEQHPGDQLPAAGTSTRPLVAVLRTSADDSHQLSVTAQGEESERLLREIVLLM